MGKNCGVEGTEGEYFRGEPNLPMKANIGSIDSGARYLLGCLIMLVGVHFYSWWALVGLVPLLTGVVRFCPLYAVLHFNTLHCDEVDAPR